MGDNHVRALPPKEAFDKRFIPEPMSGCWLWEGSVSNGYGLFQSKHSGRVWRTVASRAAWILYVGPIPDDILVCHHCDNPICVNPDHLFLGTDQDNVHDAMRKGRHQSPDNPCYMPPDAKPTTRLNAEIVRAMRRRHADGSATVNELAVEAGVTPECARHAIKGISWGHIL